MITRRHFMELGLGAAALAALPASWAAGRVSGTPTRDALVIDAMGEIRDVYTDELVREMIASGLNAVTVTLCDPKSYEAEAYQMGIDGVLAYDRLIADHPDFYLKATRTEDIDRARSEGRIAMFYLFQNATQFGRDLDNVDVFHGLGVRSSQITYNYQNWAGAGCNEPEGSGLTVFGHELVERMNAVGMLIDTSHANMRTMADTARASKDPIIVSHTCCRALYEHERNTTDANMRLIAERGGLVGVTQMRPFMTRQIDNAVGVYYEHILHAIDVAGIDHVCIGSDRDHRRLVLTEEYLAELKAEEGENFDRAMWPLYFEELNGPRRMETIWAGLADRGLSQRELEKVFGLNLQRLYSEVIG